MQPTRPAAKVRRHFQLLSFVLVAGGMTQISSPDNAVLVLGRVLVESDSDLPTAYELAKQIQLMPLSHK